MKYFLFILTFLLLPGMAFSQSWSAEIQGLGTFSSPRVTDLNNDGVSDIIIGAGRLEFQTSDSAFIALDGVTGEKIWRKGASDQIFGSAALLDIDRDGVMDAIIGGRSAELKAISGSTGKQIWKFKQNKATKATGEDRWYNFYNPQVIPDQDNDGLEDLLISNGGDVMAEPYDPNRPAGYLMVVSSADGRVLSLARMPDGREIYMSVSAVQYPGEEEMRIIFGTGGETVGGNLYVATLSEVMGGDLSGATLLDSCKEKGYIAPPLWTDITQDNIPDILVNSVDGRVLAYDGRSYERLWEVSMPGTEAYSSFGVGYFNDDGIPDLFVSFAKGVWPELHATRQYMLNGKDGTIEFEDSLGFYQTSSPIVADLNNDGYDEVILGVNYQSNDKYGRRIFMNMLASIDFRNNKIDQLTKSRSGHNVASTPWIGDLDMDGMLDILYVHSTNPYKTYAFDGMRVNRVATEIPAGKISWGAYMGSNYDGVFRNFGPERIVNRDKSPRFESVNQGRSPGDRPR